MKVQIVNNEVGIIGGDLPGFFGVLHTWGRTLEYHPHIHYPAKGGIPGGALSTTDGLWHPSRTDFYLPVIPPLAGSPSSSKPSSAMK